MNYCTDIGLPPQVVLRFIRAAFPPTRHCLGSSLRSFSEHVHFPIQCNPSCFTYSNLTYISFNLPLCDICTGSSAVFQLARQPLWTFLVWRLLVVCLLFLQLLKGCNFPIELLPVFVLKFHLDFHPKSQLRSSDNSTGVNQSRRDQVGNTLQKHHIKTKNKLYWKITSYQKHPVKLFHSFHLDLLGSAATQCPKVATNWSTCPFGPCCQVNPYLLKQSESWFYSWGSKLLCPASWHWACPPPFDFWLQVLFLHNVLEPQYFNTSLHNLSTSW